MTSYKTCTATFTLQQAVHRLTIVKAGSGSGTVTSTPAGVHCGPDCAVAYPGSPVVTLQAVPDPESVFIGWGGDAACTPGHVAMTATTTCTATFVRLTPKIILDILGRQPCAKILVEGVNVQTGSVHLGGHVASEAQRTDIYKIIRDLPGVTKVTDAFQIIPHPFCEVVELLEPVKNNAEQQGFGLEVSLNKQGQPLIYVEQETLALDIKVLGKFESYVYVDYYGTNGQIGHMFPDPSLFPEPWKKVVAVGSRVTVDGGPRPWRIQPPFGLELVTVIASKTPLFGQPRPSAEPTEPYIHALRQALSRDVSKSEMAAVFFVITTQGRH
jgi:hypothetical protein